MMIIDILTGFPEVFRGALNSSIVRNALLSDALEIWVHNLRHFTSDRHGSIDDSPYGGGPGMVLMAPPIWNALDTLHKSRPGNPARICLTPQGEPLKQPRVRELSGSDWLILLCGHYKDIDARVFERDDWLPLSLGDYILSGGELAAASLVDAIARLLPGVISDRDSAATDSFEDGLLDAPYYTRPEVASGIPVPDVLISGHHMQIEQWRRKQRLIRTEERRPDLLEEWKRRNITPEK